MLKSAKCISASILVLASVLTLPATAQIISSGSLTEVDPWGVGWKSGKTNGLNSNLWAATSAQTVNELLGSIDGQQLSPAQSNLLRAVILSGGKAPIGDINEATGQRLRLLRELGENAHANNLLQRFPSEAWSEDPHKYEADLDLATGDNQRACAAVELAPSEDPYWQTLRATCFALAGNAAAANLAAEMAVSTGEEDPWFFEAVGAIAEVKAGNDKVKLPPANYSSGAAIALSLAADLPAAPDAATSIPVTYAALLSERTDASDEIRMQAMLHAARAGIIEAAKVRRAVISPKPAMIAPDPNLPADQQPQADSDILRNPLERAVDSVTNPALSMQDKATQLIAALAASYGNAQDYSLNAKILLPELKSIPQIRETAQLSPSFVEAALAAGDIALAKKWRDAMDNTFDEPPPAPATTMQPTGMVQQPQPVQIDPATGKPLASGPMNLTPTLSQQPNDTSLTLDEQLAALNANQNAPNSAVNGQPPTIEAPPPARLPPILHSEWDKARFDVLILFATDNAKSQDITKVAQSLMAQNEQHPIESAQLLSLMSGIGYKLPPEARHLIADYQNSVPSMELILQDYQMDTALRTDATGEAVLRAFLILRDNQPHSGSLIPYTNSLNTLSQNGLEKNAKAIAFEALAPWGKPKN